MLCKFSKVAFPLTVIVYYAKAFSSAFCWNWKLCYIVDMAVESVGRGSDLFTLLPCYINWVPTM